MPGALTRTVVERRAKDERDPAAASRRRQRPTARTFSSFVRIPEIPRRRPGVSAGVGQG